VATLVLTALTFADIGGTRLDDPTFGTQLWAYVTGVELGQGQLFTIVVAAVVSLLAVGARTLRATGLLALTAMSGLIPPALAGHASGTSSHETAVTGLGLHLLGVSVWVGGLLGLLLLWPGLRVAPAAVRAAHRFSPLALTSFALVALSGVASAWIRIGSPAELTTRYGQIVVLKTVALVVLGLAGWRHRRHTLAALDSGAPKAFLRLVIGELAVMAVAVGLAAALARSAPPVPDTPLTSQTLTESLTGYPMPPAPTLARWLFSWQPDLLWVLVILGAGGLYLAGVLRMRRRGDRWSIGYTASWFAGLALVFWLTSGGPMVYGRVLFSAHMLGHMILTMGAPLLLVMGAPITLALRTLPSRHDGTRGAREWTLAVLESWYARQLTRPAVAGFLFAGTLFLFYFSPLFGLALRTHVGHELMHIHFLFSGYLFLWVIIGPDPGPKRPTPAMRMVFMFAVIAFHTFFGVALMMGRSVLASDFFGAIAADRVWGDAPLADQQFGGGLAWGLGELPTLAVVLILAIQWARADDREARRRDRAADRDGDAELEAYNVMLTRMAEQDAVPTRRESRGTTPDA
jgi:putative copper resistance protein D